MTSLWFVLALAGAFEHVRILVARNAPVVDLCDQLDLWADQLFELSPRGLDGSVLANLAMLVLTGGPTPTVH